MMQVIFNTRCSKCRGLATLLDEQEWQAVDYLNGELTPELLDTIFSQYTGPRSDLIRRNEPAWRNAGVSLHSISTEDLRTLVLAHPILLQRPLVIRGEEVLVARPPEKIWDLLGEALR